MQKLSNIPIILEGTCVISHTRMTTVDVQKQLHSVYLVFTFPTQAKGQLQTEIGEIIGQEVQLRQANDGILYIVYTPVNCMYLLLYLLQYYTIVDTY